MATDIIRPSTAIPNTGYNNDEFVDTNIKVGNAIIGRCCYFTSVVIPYLV